MKSSIQTFTGREVFPLSLEPHDIDIADVAHALAMKCRFSGHTLSFYSVAQHSVLTCRAMEDISGRQLTGAENVAGLLHDTSEAYLPDFAKPIKGHFSVLTPGFGRVKFTEYEDVIQQQVAIWAGIPPEAFASPLLKEADRAMLKREQADLMRQVEWWRVSAPTLPWQIEGVEWQVAERLFLEEWRLAKAKLEIGGAS